MAPATALRELIVPLLGSLGLELWDVEHAGGVVRVAVDREGGVDLDTVAEATRVISRALDQADPIAGRYTLEVSSPGLERNLRTPEHFRHSVGAAVKIKTAAGYDGPRRISGVIDAADDDGVVVRLTGGDAEAVVASESAEDGGGSLGIGYDEIERARTVFAWGPADRPGRSARSGRKRPAGKQKATGGGPPRHDRKAAS